MVVEDAVNFRTILRSFSENPEIILASGFGYLIPIGNPEKFMPEDSIYSLPEVKNCWCNFQLLPVRQCG